MAHSDDEFCYLCGIVIPGVSLAFVFSCYFFSCNLPSCGNRHLPVFFLLLGWSGGMQEVPKGAAIYLPLL